MVLIIESTFSHSHRKVLKKLSDTKAEYQRTLALANLAYTIKNS